MQSRVLERGALAGICMNHVAVLSYIFFATSDAFSFVYFDIVSYSAEFIFFENIPALRKEILCKTTGFSQVACGSRVQNVSTMS